MLGDIIQGVYLQYELILAKPNREEISILDAYEIEFSPRFNGIDVLNFKINYNNNSLLQEKNIDFDNVKGNYLILVNIKKNDEIIKQQYFTIYLVEDIGVEEDTKQINCYSYQYLWGKKKIRSYKSVRKIYDGQTYSFSINTQGGILDYILQYKLKGWSVSSISSSLQNVYRTFDISEMTLIELVKEIEKQYNCILIFDTVNQRISVKAVTEIGENKGLYISEENLIKKLNRSIKVDEIVTKLWVYDDKGNSINSKNITGQSWLLNVNYYRTLEYMSQSLLDALNAYDIVLANNKSLFENYLNTLSGYQSTLLTRQNELAALQAEKLQIEDSIDVERNTYNSSSDSPIYDDLYESLQLKENEIASKQSQINSLQNSINNVNANIISLNNTVSLESNLTPNQLSELDRFIFEDTIQLNISDTTQLYQEGLYQSNLKATPPIEFSIDIADMLSICEFQNEWDKLLSLGDFINIDYKRFNINSLEVRLVEFTHQPDSNSLSLKFSNKNELNTEFLYLNDIWKKPQQAATTVDIERPTYKEYEYNKDRIIYDGDTIDTSNNTIISGANYINRRGFLSSDIGSNGGRIQIKNDKIILSYNNFQSFFTMISGNGIYLETENRTSRFVLQPSTGFQLDVWNSSLNSWRNAIYLGLHSGIPALFIDNGFIKLTRIVGGQEVNDINIDPEYGIKIRAKVNSVWEDRLFLTNDGHIVAKMMRTSSSTNDYISLEDQFINFWNGGAKKLQLGFVDIGGTSFPYCIWGQGDGTEGNRAFFNKDIDRFNIVFRTSNGQDNKITFINNNYSNYPLGCIKLTGVIDCSDAGFMNFNYSYSKSETYTRSQVDDAIADAIADHVEHYHS